MQSSEPCKICGGTEMTLVDGYYYCVECGTQDTTVRETIVEKTELADGRLAVARKTKIKATKKNQIEMSGEWRKWHAFNFLINGLADEVMALGAPQSFKDKLLWIWTRYMKKFHSKEKYEMNNAKNLNSLIEDEELIDAISSGDEFNDPEVDLLKQERIKLMADISQVSITTIYAIIGCALNLDGSPIQVSDIIRYTREGRLSTSNCTKHVPKELKFKSIPQWRTFILSLNRTFCRFVLQLKMKALFRELDLGTLIIPDLSELIKRYCKELCLPKDFRELVLSLMDLMPVQVVFIKDMHSILVPNFEAIVMAYMVVALKMCFGLDDDYDVSLSQVVDEINDEEDHLKSYRVGESEPTGRLFSFSDWLRFLEFRKLVLCQFYQPIATLYHQDIDNCLVVESCKSAKKGDRIRHRDELLYNLLNKIPLTDSIKIIPIEDFPNSLTPLTAYTEFVLLRMKDPNLRVLISEDFSRYSLKYACVELSLFSNGNDENHIKGVTETNKHFNPRIKGTLRGGDEEPNVKKVFVKDSDTKNWHKDLKTLERGWYNKFENDDTLKAVDIDTKINAIEELDESQNIFGDVFNEEINQEGLDDMMESFDQNDFMFQPDDVNEHANHENNTDNTLAHQSNIIDTFDEHNFSREEAIRFLIMRTCKKYKIPIPYEYKEKREIIRKRRHSKTEEATEAKTSRPKVTVSDILSMYRLKNKDTSAAPMQTHHLQDTELIDEPDIELSPNKTAVTEKQINNLQNVDNDANDSDVSTIDITLKEIDITQNADTGDPNDSDVSTVDIILKDVDAETNNDKEFADDYDESINDIIKSAIQCHDTKKFQNFLKNRKKTYKKFSFADNVPLSELFNLKLLKRDQFIPLIKNDNLEEFNYCYRRYMTGLLRYNETQRPFDYEMSEHFPNSLRYIMLTLSSMISSSPRIIYRNLQILETYLIKKYT